MESTLGTLFNGARLESSTINTQATDVEPMKFRPHPPTAVNPNDIEQIILCVLALENKQFNLNIV